MRTLLFSLILVGSYSFISPAMAWKTEAANFTTHNTFNDSSWQSIGFRQAYTTTPIVVTVPSTSGGDPSTTRVRNVSTSGFEVSPVEPFARDGVHLAMDSAYVAIEPGVHLFPDGTVIEAGFVNTSKTQQASNVSGVNSWENVTLQHNFGSPPTIVAAIQTMNNETGENGSQAPSVSSLPWLTIAIDNIAANSFSVALERSESSQGSVTQNEQIGYIAIAQGAGGSFTDSQNQSIQFLGETSLTNIRGWSNGDTTHTFGTPFSSAPVSVFSKNTRNNPDGGWLRRNGSTSTTSINLRVDEETDNDSERTITTADAEAAGILSFSKGFDVNFPPNFTMQKSSSVISDPLNGTTNPKAIPGAVIEYTLLVTNTGYDYTDNDQFEISDALPPDTALMVTDIPSGIGPIGFVDGSTSSNTTWLFSGLSSLTDSIDFSTDGSDFSYAPTAGGEGTDAAVTHITLKPKGSFAADPPSNPSAIYTYRVIIQ
ncbi:hypothetical protein [Leucothrix arctica]|uniref:DUF11 domain-containing protein n=1 Tax=Leucothrix arctica TaxID=1481894 RepID=A0A317C458_9GAMM|nr:hypothetical protein [Leucothrix arctica]PWQ93435.1 hypothetical protein DKT75_17555 [Leucothrix arctica]